MRKDNEVQPVGKVLLRQCNNGRESRQVSRLAVPEMFK